MLVMLEFNLHYKPYKINEDHSFTVLIEDLISFKGVDIEKNFRENIISMVLQNIDHAKHMKMALTKNSDYKADQLMTGGIKR
jgi:hypothetical protein